MRAAVLLLLALTACPGPRDQVVLLPGDPASQLQVTTARGTSTLTTPYDTATVRPDGRVQPGLTTPEQVQTRFGAVLATLPEAGRLFTLHFDAGGTTLTAASQAAVPALLAEVGRRGACEVFIEGHTDQAGQDATNDPLSVVRAEAVWDLLVTHGLTATFVRVVGRGSRAPRVDVPGQAHERNRRVEVMIR